MSSHGLEGIQHSVHLTHQWISDLDAALGWDDKPRTYRLLRAVFHALRDGLPATESADFAAQLPAYLRGVYYEGWRPATTPHRYRSQAEFIDRVTAAMPAERLIDPDVAIEIVFDMLATRISAGELRQVVNALPRHLERLWPAAFAREVV
jgi:uncharacterized protein (DUF2267 family)